MTSPSAGFSSPPKEAVVVGNVTHLFLYPIKSCPGLAVEEAQCSPEGLYITGEGGVQVRDRHFMVISENGNFTSMRKDPSLAHVRVSIDLKWLHLEAPGMDKLTVPLDGPGKTNQLVDCRVWGESVEGIDCGDRAATWLTTYLKDAYRLVYADTHTKKRELFGNWQEAKESDKVAYPDNSPYLLASDGSLADLNSRLSQHVDMRHFRPNIAVSGSDAFDEDNWTYLYIGDAKFHNFKPCDRCKMTTLNPDTGVFSPTEEPLKTLKSYRMVPGIHSPCFGVNLLLEEPGTIKVGDPVYVLRK